MYFKVQALNTKELLTTSMKARKIFCLTRWKDEDAKDLVCKGGDWLCVFLGLLLLFFGGRSSYIGVGSFHCGDISGVFCGAVVDT